MKNKVLYAYLGLVILTFVNVMTSHPQVILVAMTLKFLLIAYSFMDLKEAHVIYKIGAVAYIGAASLIFALLI